MDIIFLYECNKRPIVTYCDFSKRRIIENTEMKSRRLDDSMDFESDFEVQVKKRERERGGREGMTNATTN